MRWYNSSCCEWISEAHQIGQNQICSRQHTRIVMIMFYYYALKRIMLPHKLIFWSDTNSSTKRITVTVLWYLRWSFTLHHSMTNHFTKTSSDHWAVCWVKSFRSPISSTIPFCSDLHYFPFLNLFNDDHWVLNLWSWLMFTDFVWAQLRTDMTTVHFLWCRGWHLRFESK